MGSEVSSVRVGNYEYRAAKLKENRVGLIKRDLKSGKEEKIYQSILCTSMEAEPIRKIVSVKSGIYVLFGDRPGTIGKVITPITIMVAPVIEYVEAAEKGGCDVKKDYFHTGDLIVKGGEVFAKGLCGTDRRDKAEALVPLKDIVSHIGPSRCLGHSW